MWHSSLELHYDKLSMQRSNYREAHLFQNRQSFCWTNINQCSINALITGCSNPTAKTDRHEGSPSNIISIADRHCVTTSGVSTTKYSTVSLPQVTRSPNTAHCRMQSSWDILLLHCEDSPKPKHITVTVTVCQCLHYNGHLWLLTQIIYIQNNW